MTRVRLLLGGLAALCVAAAPARGGITQQFFLSDSNKLYYVVGATPTGDFGSQVTSIMVSSGTAIPVTETLGGDAVLTSLAAMLTGALLNPPLSNLRRTGVVNGLPANAIQNTGNPLNGVFDPAANGGDGLLTLPGGAMTVGFGGAGSVADVPITQSTGAGTTFVPAGTTTTVTRRIGMNEFTSPTIVFPNPGGAVVTSAGASCAAGSNAGTPCDPDNAAPDTCLGGGLCTNIGGAVAGQNVTLDDTLNQRVGNPASQAAVTDGFFLRNTTSLIVFMVDNGSASAFGISATGFAVTGTCSNADTPCTMNANCPGGTCTDGLARRNVLNSTGDIDNSNFLPARPPTATPTHTPPPPRQAPAASPLGLILLIVCLGGGAILALAGRGTRAG